MNKLLRALLVFFSLLICLLISGATRFARQKRDISPEANATTSTPPSESVMVDSATEAKNNRLQSRSSKLSQDFNSLMAGYDKRYRPDFDGKPLSIELDAHILSFSNINEAEMEYTVDTYFGQLWNDPRLMLANATANDSIVLSGDEVEDIWLPDTIFVNSKRSMLHKVTRNNRMVTVYFDTGLCVFHTRITLWVACRMDLRRYPFDRQNCLLAIESYGFDDLEVNYKWRETESNTSDIYVYDDEMSKFDLVSAKKSEKRTRYHTENFSWTTAHFCFRRRSQYFIPRVYVPCVMIVIVSFTTFWISKDAVPARAAICITSILTLITMLGVVNANMPEVSYMKSLDIYLLVSFVFVFCVLVEYIAVLNSHLLSPRRFQGNSSIIQSNQQRKNTHTQTNGIQKRLPLRDETHGALKRKHRNTQSHLTLLDNYESTVGCDKQQHHHQTSHIDIIARFVFPMSYGFLNLAYWVVSLAYTDNDVV